MAKLQFGEILKNTLVEKRISQRELSVLCGITEVTLSRYIQNERHPRITELIKIADALNVSTDHLLGYEKNYISGNNMTVNDLLTLLETKANDIQLNINECLEYHQAKLVIEKLLKQ